MITVRSASYNRLGFHFKADQGRAESVLVPTAVAEARMAGAAGAARAAGGGRGKEEGGN